VHGAAVIAEVKDEDALIGQLEELIHKGEFSEFSKNINLITDD